MLQHKKGTNINSARRGLKKESIDLTERFISSGCTDHHQPCPCTHMSNESIICSLIHPAEGNTTSLFQDPLGRKFPFSLWNQEMLQWELRATAAAIPLATVLSEDGRICNTARKQIKNSAGPGCLQLYLPHINF